MSVALAEPSQAVTATPDHSPAPPGPRPAGPTGGSRTGRVTPEGKERSRQNGCKDGFTGAGVVLPPDAAAEVDRREAEFAQDLRPRNAVEHELVRQMALGAWRSHELMHADHPARCPGERRPVRQLGAGRAARRRGAWPAAGRGSRGHRLQLQRSSAGCDWLIGRWELLGNALLTADEGGTNRGWSEADLELALALLGRPKALRHLDRWALQAGVALHQGPVGLGGGPPRLA